MFHRLLKLDTEPKPLHLIQVRCFSLLGCGGCGMVCGSVWHVRYRCCDLGQGPVSDHPAGTALKHTRSFAGAPEGWRFIPRFAA